MRKFFRWFWAKRLRRWGLILIVGFLALSVGSVELTSQSWFCNSCHIMNTYYASWQVSPHKDVPCVRCHIAPGTENFVSAKLNGLGQVVDDILHRESTKPSASISDLSCTRSGCHSEHDIEAKDYTAKVAEHTPTLPPDAPTYYFDHSKHLGLDNYHGISVHCATCHSHVKGNEHFQVNTNVCVTCHLFNTAQAPAWSAPVLAVGAAGSTQPADGPAAAATGPAAATPAPSVAATTLAAPTRCNACHLAPRQTILYRGLEVDHAEYLAYGAACESCHRNVTASFAKVTDDHCIACHDFGAERIGDIDQLHRQHTLGKHKVECFSCHGLTAHGPAAAATLQLEQLTCVACHKGQHQVQQTTYKPQPTAPELPSLPAPPATHTQPEGAIAVSPMFMAHVDCTGCHVKQEPVPIRPDTGATVAIASPTACDACHKPGLGAAQIDLWQKNTHSLYDRAAKILADLKAAGIPPASAADVADAAKLLDLVRLDGSWGVHNPKYTESLLLQAIDKLRRAQGGAGGGP